MGGFKLQFTEFDELQKAMANFQGNVEETINDVLHNEAGPLAQDAIKRLMPTSGKTWKGKKKAAKSAKSLTLKKENLAVTQVERSKSLFLWRSLLKHPSITIYLCRLLTAE